MSAPAAESYDLKKGQLFNLLLITFASTVGFWAWTIVGPLAKYYAKPEQMNLNPGTTSLLVAMPIFIGAVGRIPIGGLTDKYGGRIMMSLVLAVSTPLVLLVGLAGSMKSFPLMLVFSFLLGIAGTVFAVGIPFSSAWYPPARKGFATGVFGAGMVGTALSAFFTPRLMNLVGYMNTHYMIAGLCAVTATISFLFLRDSPATANREVTPLMPKIIRAFKVKSTWQLCFLYSVVFGGFVAFSNYLPTYLNNIYNFDPEAAGARAAGFAAAAVVARPFGGILADKFGPKIITFIALGGVSALALVTAFKLWQSPSCITTYKGANYELSDCRQPANDPIYRPDYRPCLYRRLYRTRYLFMGERRHASRRTRHHYARHGHDSRQRRLSNFG